MVIVAAVDKSERASIVVQEATSLAKAFGEEVHVVHVLSQSEFLNLGRTAEDSIDSVSMEEIRDSAANIAAEVTADIEIPLKTIGLVGNPSNRIVDYAKNQNARYIVVAPRKRSPTGKVIFGSVAQSILLNSQSPVLTVLYEK